MSVDEIFELTKIDRWFLENIKEIVEWGHKIKKAKKKVLTDKELMKKSKGLGFSDRQIGKIIDASEIVVGKAREKLGIHAVFKLVDTCAAEFEAYTPYYYSTYEVEDESRA